MCDVYIVAANRTPLGSFLGSLKNLPPSILQSILIKDILTKQNIPPKIIEEVIIGNVLSAGQGQGIGRQVVINSGLSEEVIGYSINMVCGSGMKAIMLAESEIRSNRYEVILAGGSESMSRAPHLIPAEHRRGKKLGQFSVLDHIQQDGLTDAFHHYPMGITAENIASRYGISRKEQDHFALTSQKKAWEAIDKKKFEKEITPIEIKEGKNIRLFQQDEYPRREVTLEKLALLQPVFMEKGTVTAGNSSGINDGASATLIASQTALEQNNLTPLVKLVASCEVGLSPEVMGLGPVRAIRKLLNRVGLKASDIGLFEINEAFAAQSIGVLRELAQTTDLTYETILSRTNLNGGAIALGHPIGCSGNRIVVSLIHEMKRSETKYGVASLCIGGGMGTALLLENI